MFVSLLVAVYFILVLVCFALSLSKLKSDRSYLFLYFFVVGVIETLQLLLAPGTNVIYVVASFLYIAYFTYYFSRLGENRKLIYGVGLLAVVCGFVCIFSSEQIFPVLLGVMIAIFYIVLALLWFISQIRNTDSVFITNKQAFWVSTAILFWSVIFLFRISLMYWLAENDYEFLIVLDRFFKIAVVLTYVFFLLAVTRNTKTI